MEEGRVVWAKQTGLSLSGPLLLSGTRSRRKPATMKIQCLVTPMTLEGHPGLSNVVGFDFLNNFCLFCLFFLNLFIKHLTWLVCKVNSWENVRRKIRVFFCFLLLFPFQQESNSLNARSTRLIFEILSFFKTKSSCRIYNSCELVGTFSRTSCIVHRG